MKLAIVTGASSGIGIGIALQTSNQDAQLTIVGRDFERLEATKKLLKNIEGSHVAISCDLTSSEALDDLVASLDPLDGLVLNAGAIKLAPIAFINDEVVDQLFEVNIKSSIRLVQRLVKAKKLKKGASIVFISSIATQKTTVGNAVYNATKGAVNSLVKSLALEMATKQMLGDMSTIIANYIKNGNITATSLGLLKVSMGQYESVMKEQPVLAD